MPPRCWPPASSPPEVFVAKGRDGKTDIWGIIIRPMNFDPTKKYPVIENIYAGPQGSFVPKTFSAIAPDQALAELGFIVVQIDGMGTSNRSKAFHDVAWKNLGDAGFPDRILWHKAVGGEISVVRHHARRHLRHLGGRPELAGRRCCSIRSSTRSSSPTAAATTTAWTRSGGTSSGWAGRSARSTPRRPTSTTPTGCRARLLIIVGEMDNNVDPASSLQVVNALVKANKHFDMLYIPGQNHGVGVLASEHYRDDYFVHNLLGVEPPDWNKVSLKETPADHEEAGQ